jgi:hypothetical protein
LGRFTENIYAFRTEKKVNEPRARAFSSAAFPPNSAAAGSASGRRAPRAHARKRAAPGLEVITTHNRGGLSPVIFFARRAWGNSELPGFNKRELHKFNVVTPCFYM